MRTRLPALLAAALLLTSCTGSDSQPQPQTSPPTPAQPAVQQIEQNQQTQPADQPQPTAATANQPETESNEQTEQADQSEQTAPAAAEPQSTPPAQDDASLLAEALAAYQAWSRTLESFELVVDNTINAEGMRLEFSSRLLLQLEPFTLYTTFEIDEELGDALGIDANTDPFELSEFRLLLLEDAAYMAMPQQNSWRDVSYLLDSGYNRYSDIDRLMNDLFGVFPEDLADLDQFGRTLPCVDLIGGSVVEQRYNGQPAWVIECRVELDQLDADSAPALANLVLPLNESGLQSMTLRLTTSQASGAPLLMEWSAAGSAADDDQQGNLAISSRTHLLSWNEPLELPDPEAPLVNLVAPEVIIDLFNARLEEQLGDLQISVSADAEIDDEWRRSGLQTQVWRNQGIFERLTLTDSPPPTYSLLSWNRDGLWISDDYTYGSEPQWEPANPAQQGFGNATVDEYIADLDKPDLQALRPLLPLATVGNRGHEMIIEAEALDADHPFFEPVVAQLRAYAADVLPAGLEFQSIDRYAMTLRLGFSVTDPEPESVGYILEINAECQTNEGPVTLYIQTLLNAFPPAGELPIEPRRPN